MIGIDFGTSTTEVAVVVDGIPRLLTGPGGDRIIPSVVSYPPVGPALVGAAAQTRWRLDPENTIHSIKRIVGRRWYDQEVADFREVCAFGFHRAEGHAIEIETRAGRLSPEAIAETLLRRIVESLDLPPDSPTTLGAPPAFGAEPRLALQEIATRVGLTRVVVIDEPYAALLPHLVRSGDQKKVLVFDLGGGTFDLAVLEVRGKVHRILSRDGDPYLGGDDIDLALAEWARAQVLVKKRWDLRARTESWIALIGVCREAKERLARIPSTRLALGLTDPVVAELELTLTADTLRTCTREIFGRCFALCDHVLREAGLRASAIDEIVLSGGSTRLPLLQEAVAVYFGREPIRTFPPDELVALGAALAAAARA